MPETTHAYIGKKPCGCIVAAVIDDPTRPRETAKDVARFIRNGLAVERVTVEQARAASWGCKCQ